MAHPPHTGGKRGIVPDFGQLELPAGYRYTTQLSDSGALAYEQLATYAGWEEQALKLLSLERQYVKDLARDHVWRYDRSPARALERQQSLERTFALAMGDRQPTRAPTQERTPTRQRPPVRQRLQELAAALKRMDDTAPAGAALNVRLYDREREQQDRGIGW